VNRQSRLEADDGVATPYRGLNPPEPLAMRWRVRPSGFAATETDRLDTAPLEGEGAAALVDLMTRVGSMRAALIGPAGAGKTTLAALLAREILDRRKEITDRIPVVIPLMDWNPRTVPLPRLS
jgi:hypothetical protein